MPASKPWRIKMISSYAKTAQIKNKVLGLDVDKFVGVKHHSGEFFHVYENNQYIGLARESDLKNGVL